MMPENDSDNEIDIPCVGVCIVDEAGYCLGCGRPPAPVVAAASAPVAGTTGQPADQPAVAVASAVSTTLTQ